MQRFVIADDFGLITKGNQEYETEKNTIKLTLLRASGVISNAKNPSRGTPAGPPLKTPKLQCLGKNSANFAITFAKDEKQMFETAENFYSPCIALFSNLKDINFFKPSKNELVYGIKIAYANAQMANYNLKTREIKNIVIKT